MDILGSIDKTEYETLISGSHQLSDPYVPILVNSHRTVDTETSVEIVSTQTSPFDSIFQIYAACYTDVHLFNSKIDSDSSEFSALMKKVFKSFNDVYNQRSKILLALLPDKVIERAWNVKTIDSKMSINQMFLTLSTHFPIIQSFRQYKKCSSCSFESERIGKSFIPTDLKSLDLKNIQASIHFSSKKFYCPVCKADLSIFREFNEIISFDVELLDHQGKHRIINLKDVSKHIHVDRKKYTLRGIIEWTYKHFVAHVRRNDDTWETFDDIAPARPGKTPTSIKPVMLFYSSDGDIKRDGPIIRIQDADDVEIENEIIDLDFVESEDDITDRVTEDILQSTRTHSMLLAHRYVPILANSHQTIGTMGTAETNVVIISTQTCPFDSIFQVYAACYADLASFNHNVDSDSSEFSHLIKNVFQSSNDVYEQRSEILLTLFPERIVEHGENIMSIDSKMSINQMFSKLSTNFPLIQSFRQHKKCSSCSFESEKIGKSCIPTDLKSLDFLNFQASIHFSNKTSLCPFCNANLSIFREFNDIISFDIEKLDDRRKHQIVKLNEITLHIYIEGKQYVLRGIIECTYKHFVAHVRRNDNTWETYDDVEPSKPLKTPKRIKPVMLFFTSTGVNDGLAECSESTGAAIVQTVHDDQTLGVEVTNDMEVVTEIVDVDSFNASFTMF